MKSENTKNSNTDNSFIELRDIRKDKGLTIKDVARQLKLSSDVITKIETNALNELGAYTYVRGYILNYSNLLGVEPDKYIALIPKSEMEIPLINTAASNSKGIKFKRQSKNMVSYALGTFIVLTVSFSGWYLLKNYTNSAKTNNIEIVDKTQLEIFPQKQLPLEDNSVKSNSNSESTGESYHYSSLIPDIKNEEDKNNSIEVPKKNEQEETALDHEQKNSTIDSSFIITVVADETSWVKVEYLSGKKKLHNDLLEPGAISFESIEPVHFRIGNSKMVKVSINGENIDLSEHSRKNIADFNWPLDS